MIADLLPHYYAINGRKTVFTPIRSILIDGHEVAWLERIECGSEGQVYTDRRLFCECRFIEGIGWERTGHFSELESASKCIRRKAAIFLRQRELREEYLARFRGSTILGGPEDLRVNIAEIIQDLLQKVDADDFIGEDGAAKLTFGTHFYISTLAEITGLRLEGLMETVKELANAGHIHQTNMVIQPAANRNQAGGPSTGRHLRSC